MTAAHSTTTTPSSTVEPRVTDKPDHIVKRFVLMSAAVSCLPVPLVDIAGVMGLQLVMLKDLSEHYGIKFSENKVKNILGSVIGSLGAAGIVAPLVASGLKLIPGVGAAAGVLALPGAAAAMTYAVGRVFTQHFASGGTFLDFDVEKTRAYFEQHFREGQKHSHDRKESLA